MRLDHYASLLIKDIDANSGDLVYRISNAAGQVIEGPVTTRAVFEGSKVFIGSATISLKDYYRIVNTLSAH